MGMLGGLLNQFMQMVQQMQGSECGVCSQDGQNDPAKMFQQNLQQIMQPRGCDDGQPLVLQIKQPQSEGDGQPLVLQIRQPQSEDDGQPLVLQIKQPQSGTC